MMATRLSLMEVCPQAVATGLTVVLRHTISNKAFDNIKFLKSVCSMTAFTFASNFTCHILYAQYNKMMNNITKKNDFSMLGPLHQVLAGLKALICGESFEHCKSLSYLSGAHGYHTYSGFTKLIDQVSPFVTLEGDAIVMNLQTAKSLIKKGYKVLSGKNPKLLRKSSDYINELPLFRKNKSNFVCSITLKEELAHGEPLIDLLKYNSLYHLDKTLVLFAQYKELSTWEKFFQKCEIEMIKLSELHSWYMTA